MSVCSRNEVVNMLLFFKALNGCLDCCTLNLIQQVSIDRKGKIFFNAANKQVVNSASTATCF